MITVTKKTTTNTMHLQTLFQTGCSHCDLCLYQVSRPSAILTLKSSSLLTRVTVRSVMGSCIGRLETFCLHRHLSNDLPGGPQPPSRSWSFPSSCHHPSSLQALQVALSCHFSLATRNRVTSSTCSFRSPSLYSGTHIHHAIKQ